jgi:hypothetical protein
MPGVQRPAHPNREVANGSTLLDTLEECDQFGNQLLTGLITLVEASSGVALEYYATHTGKCRLNRRYLRDDLTTITPLLDHALHPAYLAFDPPQSE